MLKRILFFAIVGVAARWFLWPVIFKESAADSFAIKELQGHMKAGFVEVSPDWDRFLKEWDDSASKKRKIAVARSIADYASFAELATVYRLRAEIYAKVATDPKLSAICDGTISNRDVMGIADDVMPAVDIVGRTMARMYLGEPAWKPPVNLKKDGPWLEFAIYLSRIGKGDILDGLRAMGTGKGVSREERCKTMGALFSLAGNRPADTMGTISIMDFVRSMESFVLTQMSE